MPKVIKVGCCGWAEAHQKYFKDFKVIEIQETFYNLEKISRYEKWREEAPEDFEFVIKAWMIITHSISSPTYRRLKNRFGNLKNYGFFKSTPEVLKAWEKTERIARALRTKIIVFQCPASFKPEPENIENLRRFFKKIKTRDFIYAWEPRGKWEEGLIKKLCQELDLVHCVDPFKTKPLFGKINYFRLHGQPGYNLRYKYTDQDLKKLLEFCNKKENYILFNNISMLDDALRFLKAQIK